MRMLVLLVLAGCAGSGESAPVGVFPADFRWGAATAGFQVDMGCPTWSPEDCEDRASDWYQWVTDPEIVADGALHVTGEPVSNGPGMWETFEADVDRMAADGMTAYRMSIEWSRLFPVDPGADATDPAALAAHVDAAALARYGEQLDALRAAGIEPVITLNHYTLPLWVHDGVACHADLATCPARGWVDAAIIDQIAAYSAFCATAFGDRVDTWATLNEPLATVLSGYVVPGPDRSAPPGLGFAPEAVDVWLHQIEGHAAMASAVRAADQQDADGDGVSAAVGIVLNMVAIEPGDPEDPVDLQAAEDMDYLYHRVFLDALTAGAWDPNLDGVVDETRTDLAGSLDWLGINYYNRVTVTGIPLRLLDEVPLSTFYPDVTWDPYTPGLSRVLLQAAAYDLPLWVTENGTPFVEEQGVEILDGHLAALQGAMLAGADVRGYLYWSYVDNYEWNHGFDLLFGLYALDLASKERTPRPVLERLREVMAAGQP